MPSAPRRESPARLDFGVVVRVVGARLPPVEVGLVEEVEEEDRDHRRLAGGELERLAVVLRLGLLAHRVACRAGTGGSCTAPGRSRGSPTGRRTPCTRSAGPSRAARSRRRPRRAGRRACRSRRCRARFPCAAAPAGSTSGSGTGGGEDVHDRLRPAARPVGRAHVADERRRRVRWPRRLGVVEAARGEVAAVDLDLRVDRLQRVVGRREQSGVVPCGDVSPVLVELVQPEAVQVRLVPDREAAGPTAARARSSPMNSA